MARHVIVDGSNLATEGRVMPSLRQLNEAVLAYMEENPGDIITVVVDATFGHRIDPRELAEFDAAVENNELVAPPAGAIGRGDAFVLAIANKVKASVISNDSYQEFHGGEYDWLFDEGRLIGGKPVPNVGWVFVPRVPVRGPISRRAVKDAKKPTKASARGGGREPRKAGRASKEASLPMPVPSAPPPGLKSRTPAATPARVPKPAEQTDAPTASRPHMVNDLLPFLGFVEQHPVGTTAQGVVDSYSSHGAYVSLGEARGYVPLRLMAEQAPRSAREMMKLGDTVDLVVVSFNPTRRSIDLCVPGMEPAEVKAAAAAPVKRARKKAGASAAPAHAAISRDPGAAAASGAREKPAKRTSKKAGAPARAASEATAAPPPAAPVKRTRKKAGAPAAPADAAISRDPGAAGASGAREKPAKRTTKKADEADASSGPAATTKRRPPRAKRPPAPDESSPAPDESPSAPDESPSAPDESPSAPAKRSRTKATS